MTDFRALCAELTDALDNLHAFVTGYERDTVSRTPEGGLPPLLSE